MNSRPLKRRKGSPPPSGEGRTSRKKGPTDEVEPAFFNKNAANWDLERDYAKKAKKQKTNDRLPIRTADGVLREAVKVAPESGAGGEDAFGSDDSDSDNGHSHGRKDKNGRRHGRDAERTEEGAKPRLSEAQQVRVAKEELAKIALKLNENPEDNPGAFKALAQVARQATWSVAVQKLCIATQMAVYKDVIPGYRIRTLGEEPAAAGGGEKLSSDVRRIRAFEQSLLAGYQGYLRELSRLGRGRSGGVYNESLANVALTCACTLLNSVPHFNFREDLLRIIVGRLSGRRVDESFVRCRTALETLFREDEEGRPSMETVALLAKMMRARDYRVDESVLNTFLHLRLLSEFSGKASQDRVDRPGDDETAGARKSREKKEFRTKRQRKQLKEQKALDRDLAQADALVAHEERDRMQSETLKLVFATYFRILKLRVPNLMGAVLEGLAKYAHLINQDFFGDLLEALKDLVRYGDGQSNSKPDADDKGDEDEDDREALLCTVTAYALLAGQDAHNARSDLHLDLSFFTTHLFRSLFPLALEADIEKRAGSLQQKLADATGSGSSSGHKEGSKVNLQTTTVLLVRCLTAVLLPPYNIRSVPPLRLAAFSKQLMSVALHVPEKSTQAVLALLLDVADTHGKKISALWNTEERKGDGTFQPLSETVETSNPFATTVWEGELLRRHYCPKVREGVKALEKSLTM
ncbi:nuclear export protein noc3 [Grosmannia clavigera kw1407]|uniref:Nucleolar complex-associated protein 3 n=1 Tax=Grosmannia clavigera (strain kw1407 / UAMH 11150) TaxID=655863 RepID=F0XPK3_GROCL|nr:nuclear export protein noc3 [Grosmannia clavigera kw1407]EFX00636.1 nuclear export protein noc3 [Grosmannia clavigera kw1407]